MMRRLSKRDGRRGAAAVEFALVLPLFVAVLFGVIEYGWVFYQTFSVAAAVRDGLRVGVTVPQSASPDMKAQSAATASLNGLGITTATVTAQMQGVSPSRTLSLSATMPYKPIIGFVPVPAKISYAMTMMLELQ